MAGLLIEKFPEAGSFVDISIALITSFEEGGVQLSRDDSARVVKPEVEKTRLGSAGVAVSLAACQSGWDSLRALQRSLNLVT